ncbi:MAG: GAF domain-containing protein [Acidimicrobiales bacterium]
MTDTLPPPNVKTLPVDDIHRIDAFRGLPQSDSFERRDLRDEGELAADERRDRLEPFGPAVLAIRWATVALSVSLAAPAFVEADRFVIVGVIAVIAVAAVRSVTPQRDTGDSRATAEIVAELAVHAVVVTLTGLWQSPLLFSLMSTVVIAGFARGFAFGLRIAATTAAALTAGLLLTTDDLGLGFELPDAIRWSAVLLLVGVVAGYGRRISGEADRQHSIALGRMNRLADANALLFNLHRIAQTLPASLNQDEALDSTISRLRSLVTFDSAAILTLDESDGNWVVARRQAMAIGQLLDTTEMPGPVRRAIASKAVTVSNDLAVDGPGFNPGSGSGVYAPLMARGSLIGILCIEARDVDDFDARDVEVLRRYVEPAALAIDNARWFGRLRTVGADEERTRIARDLHDRIGQSLGVSRFRGRPGDPT